MTWEACADRTAGRSIGALADGEQLCYCCIMVASAVSFSGEPVRWLFLIHQLPPKPDYLRVKVRRRIQKLGAVPLKNSVYVLPRTEAALEDFQWLANEIIAEEGDATICAASLLSGVSDEDLESLFRTERAADYLAIAESASSIDLRSPRAFDELNAVRRRLATVSALDFFEAPEKERAERAVSAAERRLQADDPPAEAPEHPLAAPRGATWVTRRGVFVDRIASAWLIRRVIDPDARFRFVEERHRPAPGELRFDMYGGEFTHDGDRCTFETLLRRFALESDPALAALGEIVHDIDCKDEKFARDEAAGVAAVIRGIATGSNDDQRIERGTLVFDALYEQLRHQR